MGQEPEQAGVIAHRSRGNGPEFLLVTSRSSGRWIIPKGNIEPDLTARESAEMEAYEEGGIKGKVNKSPIGTYPHGSGETREVQVFLMEVRRELKDWPEAHERKRKWMRPDEAMNAVDEKELKVLLAQAVVVLESSQ